MEIGDFFFSMRYLYASAILGGLHRQRNNTESRVQYPAIKAGPYLNLEEQLWNNHPYYLPLAALPKITRREAPTQALHYSNKNLRSSLREIQVPPGTLNWSSCHRIYPPEFRVAYHDPPTGGAYEYNECPPP